MQNLYIKDRWKFIIKFTENWLQVSAIALKNTQVYEYSVLQKQKKRTTLCMYLCSLKIGDFSSSCHESILFITIIFINHEETFCFSARVLFFKWIKFLK